MNFKKYFSPETITEAYDELIKSKRNRVLGGSSYLRMSQIDLDTVIDLSKLGLDKITEDETSIRIGAMVTFRDIETNPITCKYLDGILSKSIAGVLGVQFRNNVTVGATIASKYGFSDLITPLLAIGSKVVMHNQGEITLEEYLTDSKVERDILLSVIVPKKDGKAIFKNLRKSSTDYSIINLAVFKEKGLSNYSVTIGARPSRAKLIKGDTIDELLAKIDSQVEFQSNTRGSLEYRRELSKKLLEKALKEVEC